MWGRVKRQVMMCNLQLQEHVSSDSHQGHEFRSKYLGPGHRAPTSAEPLSLSVPSGKASMTSEKDRPRVCATMVSSELVQGIPIERGRNIKRLLCKSPDHEMIDSTDTQPWLLTGDSVFDS